MNKNQNHKVTFIKISNPFNHSDREIKQIEYIPGATVGDYARNEGFQDSGNEIILSMNGHVVDNMGLPVAAGSYIAMAPTIRGGEGGGKNTLALIAGIALSVVAMGVGSVVSGGAFMGSGALAMGSWSWAGYLAAMAVMWVGGMLVSRMTPKPELDIEQQSVTYSWNPGYLLQGQGHAVGIIYGTVRPTMTVLSQHISSDGEKQYLNLVLCVGDGPIDSITEIKINDNPIENYQEPLYEVRLGTNNQEGFDRGKVLNFLDTYADQPLSYELELAADWVEHQTDGNSANGLEIELSMPGGLYHVNDDGATVAASVTVEAEYKKAADEVWTNFWDAGVFITAMTQQGVAYTGTGPIYNISLGISAAAEVWTITCTESQNTSGNWGQPGSYAKKFSVVGSVSGAKADAVLGTRYTNGYIAFDITETQYCGTGYVFTITIGAQTSKAIGAASTSAIRRVFRVDNVDNVDTDQYDVRVRCTAKSGTTTRDVTRVFWTNLSSIIYDDFVRPCKALIGMKILATGQLSGSMPNITCLATRSTVYVWNSTTLAYETQDADNPAWAAYDLIHRAKYLYNVNAAAYQYIVRGAAKEKLIYQDFKDWGDFCDTKSLKVNYFLEKATDLWTALRELENCGRGKVILRGTRFGAICDSAADPVQLFTVGNIIKDTFREEFLPMKDRANSLEITFNNKDKNYERDVITVYGDTYDTSTTVKHPTQITFDGITDFDQAYKEAAYRLRLNKYLTRTVSFEAGADAIACQVGDVILVQHDVPQWGYGGRIISVVGRILTLDRSITFAALTDYSILVRLSATDAIVQKNLVQFGVETTTATVTTTTDFATEPAKHDVYTLGEIDVEAKPFRVANITRASDLTRRITALEYVEAVYTEATDVPTTSYSALTPYIDAYDLRVGQETYAQRDGTAMSVLYVSWNVPRNREAKSFHVFYTRDNVNWLKWGETDQTSITIMGVKALETYVVKICTLNELNILSPGIISASCYVTGKDLPPSDVTALTAVQDPNDKRKIALAWTGVTNVDLRGYLVYESGVQVSNYLTDTAFSYTATETKTHVFTVYAVDRSGNLSTTAATASVSVTVEPSDITGFAVVVDPYNRTQVLLSWNALTEIDLSFYEIRRGDTWADGTVIQQTKATSFTYALPAGGYYRFWIKAVTLGGHYSVTEAGAAGQFEFESAAPTAAVIAQDANDRTRLVVTWTAVADADVSGYEVRLGYDWATGTLVGIVKEASIAYVMSASGTYNFMIRAKNVAGYYSATLNVSGAYTIEPSTVTGFTGTQSENDHTTVRLTWNPVSERDVNHYEIREGTSWENGTLVYGNVVGTFYDATVTEERTYKFWIKSVSKAAIYCISATLFSQLWSLNPDQPENLAVTTDPTDRSKAIITWDANMDRDLKEYEVRYGIDWINSTLIAKTKENSLIWTPPSSNSYAIRIRARNNALFESDEEFYVYSATLEPSKVTEFRAMQNGESVLLTWTKSADVDVVGYEIREGGTFDSGMLVATGVTGTAFQFTADKETTRTFQIKAVNRTGRYSQEAAWASVTIANLLPRNVILSFDEITLQTGTKAHTAFGGSQYKYSTLGGKFSDWPTTRFSDIGGASVLKLEAEEGRFSNLPGTFQSYPLQTFADIGFYFTSGTYETTVKDVGKSITANIAVDFVSSTLLTLGTTALLEYRLSNDNVVWTDYQPFISITATFRYCQFKVTLTTTDRSKTPEVNQFTINIDVPDTIKNGKTTVAVGGSTINYNYTYWSAPSVAPSATTLGDRATLSGTPSITNFNVRIYDPSGNDVGGEVVWISRGY